MNRLPSLDECLQVSCVPFNATPHDVISSDRRKDVCDARAVFCAVAHEVAERSWPDIGRFICRRAHSTAAAAGNRAMKDPELARCVSVAIRAAKKLAARAAEVG